MKTFYVCGTPWCPLTDIQYILNAAGFGVARPAADGSIKSLDEWHTRLFQGQVTDQTHVAIQPGRAWESSASEILLANWDQPVWCWADSRITWLLDFWLTFDQNIKFVLVHTPIRQLLVRALADTHGTEFDSSSMLDGWCAYQSELLRFYHRNRSHCVLVQSDAVLQNPTSFIQSLNTEFGLALSSDASIASITHTASALDQLLADRLLQDHPQAHALQQEIAASLPEDVAWSDTTPPATSALVDELRQYHRVRNTADTLQEQNELLALQIQELQGELERNRQAHQQASQEKLQQFESAQHELTQENELLLLQLHQVQEELEHYFLEHQKASQDKQIVEAKLLRLQQHYPAYCVWDSIVPLPGQALTWQIEGLGTAGRELALAHFGVSANAPGSTEPVLHVTLTDPQGKSLWLHPQDGALDANALSTSDWQLLQNLCKGVAAWLPTDTPDRASLLQVLTAVQQHYARMPASFRFDTVTPTTVHKSPTHEQLCLTLSNVSFGPRHWPSFVFRLGAYNLKKNKFSGHPKLEVPKVTQGAPQFENWFVESEDEHGPKFEIRMETVPPALDLKAWNSLSPLDQAQARSLAAQLPYILSCLQRQGATVQRPLADWMQLASDIPPTLAACLP